MWVRTWDLGQDPLFLWPVLSPPETKYLVWAGGGPSNSPYLFFAQIAEEGAAPPETVATISPYQIEYSAAVSTKRRWAAIYDYVGVATYGLRAFSSSALRSWREMRLGNVGANGVSLAALDDTTGLVALADGDGVRLGILGDSTWTSLGLQVAVPGAVRPRFRPRPSGGHWLAWGPPSPFLPIATFRDGTLGVPDIVHCAYRAGPESFHLIDTPDLSRDAGEYPAVAWGAQFYGHLVLCVCMPTDSGFTVADEIPGAAGGTPSVARDRNGDVWVGSWDYFDPLNWLHTYTTATATNVRIEDAGRHRRVAWTLSEPAPETWWAVLKASRGGEFTPVARVRAGPGLEMSWSDPTPPAGQPRYKVRRECVDARYRWESAETGWPQPNRKPRIVGRIPNPVGTTVELELAEAAPGPLELRLYDLQGRAVLRQGSEASGGSDRVVLRLDAGGPLPRGVYFLRVTDAAGGQSDPVKLVILR